MEYIHPNEIGGKITTLIDEAEKTLIIISPYNKISNWEKLKTQFTNAKKRGISIEYYIRKDVDNNASELASIQIQPIPVENLHAKVYMNEKYGIVTSMNLSSASDSKSIDIGFQTETEEEYADLIKFYAYLKKQYERQILPEQRVTTNKSNPLTKPMHSASSKQFTDPLDLLYEIMRKKYIGKPLELAKNQLLAKGIITPHINLSIAPKYSCLN